MRADKTPVYEAPQVFVDGPALRASLIRAGRVVPLLERRRSAGYWHDEPTLCIEAERVARADNAADTRDDHRLRTALGLAYPAPHMRYEDS